MTYSPEIRERALNLYKSGLSSYQVAAKLGMDSATVSLWVQQKGISRKWVGSPEHKAQLERLHKTWVGSPEHKAHLEQLNGSPEHKAQFKRAQKHAQEANPSKLELVVKSWLDAHGIKYIRQFSLNGRFTVDFYLPNSKTIIEVDGCYWHKCPQCGYGNGLPKDNARNAYIRACGYNLLIIPEHEIKDGFPSLCSQLS